jgi:hypothetical protein
MLDGLFSVQARCGELPEIERPVVSIDIHPYKWLSIKFVS